MKTLKTRKKSNPTPPIERMFFWGMNMLLFALLLSLCAYYLYSHPLRQISFIFILISLSLLFLSMAKDLASSSAHTWISGGVVLCLLLLYFMQRMEFNRFDFSVGDASDYFLAGVCSVTYSQDIGFFLPLTASISALGYDIIGITYAPLINVIIYAASIPLLYFIFKKLTLSSWIALLFSVFFTFLPLSIWFSKTSFSEPLWQILILIFMLNIYHIMHERHLSGKTLSIFYLLLFLVPFLRGEAVLYFGLILFLILYHFWKYGSIKSSLFLVLGAFVLSMSTHLVLQIRAHYLLQMQFSRILPDITEMQLMSIFYTTSILFALLVMFLSRIINAYKKLPLFLVIVLFSLIFRIAASYYFSLHKNIPLENILFLNEYGFIVGNFGLPFTFLIYIGLILLYVSAINKSILSLLIVVSYTLFSIPFMMQNVHFNDVHAFFLYWNRYYFSILMIVHLFALSLSINTIYTFLHHYIKKVRFIPYILLGFFLILISISMNKKIYQIVVSESHQQGSYKLYEWLKENVQQDPILVVMDKDILYKQNKGHIGINDLKYLLSRAFSIYKINAKHYQRVHASKLTPSIHYDINTTTVKHVLCLSTTPCDLGNKELREEKKLLLNISWRQHLGLDRNASKIHHDMVEKSVVKHLPLYATLYKEKPLLALGRTISFQHKTIVNNSILRTGWSTLSNSGALSKKGEATLSLSTIDTNSSSGYTLTLKFALMDAANKSPKKVIFSHNNKKIKQVYIDTPYTRTIKLHLSKSNMKVNTLSIHTSPQGYFILRSLKMSELTKESE